MNKIRLLLIAIIIPFALIKAQDRRSNPIVSHMFTADPSAHVWKDGRLYVYPSTDVAPAKGYSTMDGYHVFSTDDMISWKDHGEILHSSQVEWGRKGGGFMWAPDCAYRNGMYYFFFPHKNKDEVWEIGVATSKNPASDFKVQGYIKGGNAFCDPCVFIDENGQAYLFAVKGAKTYAAKLKENLMEVDGEMQLQTGLEGLREGPFVFKRKNKYYLMYPDDFPKFNKMRYAMSNSPLGPWEPKGVFLGSNDVVTTHGSMVEYKGQWYLFYHTGNLSGSIGPQRSICFDPVSFNADGTIQMVKQNFGVQLPTFHKDIHFNGMMGTLEAGNYKEADLKKHGILPTEITSLQIPEGFRIECYEKDNFTGKSWIFEEDRIDLNAIGCNNKIHSIKISKSKVINLVKNPSFELATQKQLKFWLTKSTKSYEQYLDSSAIGYYSLQYNSSKSEKEMVQNLNIKPSTSYELSVKMKIDAGTIGKVVFDTNGTFDTNCKFELDATTKAGEWVEFKGVFNSGDASKVQLRCLTSDGFKGSCYWDDVVLKEK